MEELKKTEMKEGDNELHRERGNSHTMSEVDLMITELHKGDAMDNTGRDGPGFVVGIVGKRIHIC